MSLRSNCWQWCVRLVRRLRQTQSLAAPPYAGVITEATNCLENPDRAAGFVRTGGLDRLAEAIDAAEADGRTALATEGRRARDGLTEAGIPTQTTARRGTDIPPGE